MKTPKKFSFNEFFDSNMMNINDFDISDLIPQRRPFVMVDRLTECDDDGATSELTFKEDNIFRSGDVMTESGMMENIAQTCAARIGYLGLLNNEPVKIGVIGGIKNMQFFDSPRVGDTLVTKVSIVSVVFNVTLVNAKVFCNGKLMAEGDMKIALT